MAEISSPDLIIAQPDDADRLASLSHAAKLSYRAWAQPGWEPPGLPTERARWARRLGDPAGWTLIAFDSNATLGTVHFTDARTDHGAGEPLAGRAHLSGLFVLPARWAEGIGSTLLEAALVEMRSRGYREAQLFTAAANRRSAIFYERRGWQPPPSAPPSTTTSGSPATSVPWWAEPPSGRPDLALRAQLRG